MQSNYSHRFRSCRSNLDIDLLSAEYRMQPRQLYSSRLFFCAEPHCPSSPHQRKRIVSDNFGGTVNIQLDGVVGQRADSTKFVSDAQDDASCVRSVSN